MSKNGLNVSTKEVKTVSVSEFAQKLGLRVISEGRGYIELNSISVSRPGLQLAGYFEHFSNKRVQIIGNAEHDFLRCLPTKARKKALDELFKRELPCMVVARNLEITDDLAESANQYDCPLLLSESVTSVLIHDLMVYLNVLFAPTDMVHGVLLDIAGVGVLITGNAGIGKSETALDLITRGHRLVADDTVLLKNTGEKIMGTSPEKIQYFMEVRGIGIINVKNMFGSGSVRPEKSVDIIVELVPWAEINDYDRLGNEKILVDILGIKKQKVIIPVSPGRNIPIIIETAARKFRLEEFGYNAIDELVNATFGKKD